MEDVNDLSSEADSVMPDVADEAPVKSIAPFVEKKKSPGLLNRQACEQNRIQHRRLHNKLAKAARKRNRR
jgi:hypothetical protein